MVTGGQCDQMARLFVRYLTINSDEILPNGEKRCQSSFKIFPNTKKILKNLAWTIKFLPKWWNFAKSGHIGGGMPSLNNP